MDEVVEVGLDRLRAHPGNSNVMGEEALGKLVEHIRATGRYPPLVVRGVGETAGAGTADAIGGFTAYEVLDGHHRWEALRRLGHERAACVVWEVDDEGALVLLATLNRLRGKDDPRKRAAMIGQLHRRFGRSAVELAKRLPESSEQVRKYLALNRPMPRLAPAKPLDRMPMAVHFFLTGEQKQKLDETLKRIGGTREAALMEMVSRF